ncbi:MAG: hypothetical protein NT144_04105 [Bacteroidia bacterium]|nr:hypothetical protein [Bacteroidia bacterium]
MKRKPFKLFVSFVLMLVVSCDEPKTVVTNLVHQDGSVTRKIEMRNIKNIFKLSGLQVPFDSTWAVNDTIEISEKGDTTWIKRAEKLFKNIDEINLTYKRDSGANKDISRHAGFKKRFKWFNTEFRFSEKIDKKLSFGYPVGDFLNNEELLYFYSPENVKHDKENSVDSLKFRALSDSVSHKTDTWGMKSLVSMWIGEFTYLTEGKAENDMSMKSLKAREDEFVNIVGADSEKFDSLWGNGIILKKFIGEDNALKFKAEVDTAIESVTRNFFVNFKDYSVRIVMPGKVIGTNGFIDSSEVLLWPVKSDYFLTEPYEMWAESKIPNRWAWIVSGLFLVFVLTGVIIRVIKKS